MRYLVFLMFSILMAGTAAHATSMAPATSTAEPLRQTTWMSVLLENRKIGSLSVTRVYAHGTVTTTQTLSIEFARVGQPLRLASTNETVEGTDGEPLAFSAKTSLSDMDSTVEGHRINGRHFSVTTRIGGATHRTELDLDPNVLMFDGQRKAMMSGDRRPGTRYTLKQFDPATQQVLNVDMEVIGKEQVTLPEGTVTLDHQRQRLALTNGDQVIDLWLDDQGIARKGALELLGHPLQMIACDEACARAPVQNIDMFRSAFVESPRPLTPNLRAHPLTYRIHASGKALHALIRTDEQHIRPAGRNEVFVDIRSAAPGGQPGPTPADTAATPWLQSDAPAIRELAERIAGGEHTHRGKMRRLRSFVSGYITEHGLDVGYASALEVLNSRKGDCTEYAVLLAALARAQGIPTRVVSGMVYADRFAGSFRVFVPHAWVQSWVHGRWESYDAALQQFDATHIALATGNGDPASYFGAAQLFGQLHIDRVMTNDELLIGPPVSPPSPPVVTSSGKAD